jgi:hypothetical protein
MITAFISGGCTMKNISELVPHVKEVEIFEMPEIKLIGKEVRCGGVIGNKAPELWDYCIADGTLETLRGLSSVIKNSLLGWTGNYTAEDDSYSYIIGVLTPLDTPVAKGFTFRILPSTLVAKGIYDEGYSMIEVYQKMGYTQNYDLRGWNAEIYFKDDPDPCKWTSISPIRKV